MTAVLAGGVVLSPDVEHEIVQRALGKGGGRSEQDVLTDQELDVFQMLGRGMTTREIARRKDLSVRTVETYRDRAKDKLGFHSAHDLLRHAFEFVMLDYSVKKQASSG